MHLIFSMSYVRFQRISRFCISILWGLFSILPANAALRLPRLFQDGMVLQRGALTQLWGRSDPGETVTVSFVGQTMETRADASGKWMVRFGELKAGGPYELQLQDGEGATIVLHEVYVGDVWVCSGQSNMELQMDQLKYRFPEIITDSGNPLIRHFEVPDRYDFKQPLEDLEAGAWIGADPESVLGFTAVGYLFAKEIQTAEAVPIGLINASLGGSPVQSWMSEEALQRFPADLAEGKRWADDTLIEETTAREQAASADWYSELWSKDAGVRGDDFVWADPTTATDDWVPIELPGVFEQNGIQPGPGVVWLRKTIELTGPQSVATAQLWLGRIVDADKVFLNGQFVGEVTYQYPPRIYDIPQGLLKTGRNTLVVRVVVNGESGQFFKDKPYYLKLGDQTVSLEGSWLARRIPMDRNAPGQTFIRWKPNGLFNAMIAPLLPYAIKGVIWYQGESNTKDPSNYQEMVETMVMDWRDKWVGGVPFPFLAVQLANLGEPDVQPGDDNWSRVREQQYHASIQLPASGLAVIYDVGEWNDIHPLDKVTVGKRLALCAEAIAYGKKGVVFQGPAYLEHQVLDGEIRVRFDHVGAGGLHATDGADVGGFAIAGEQGVFYWAQGRIEGDTVVLSCPEVSEPVAVRYAWSMNPSRANLYNSAGLPAVPFRTDR